MLLVGTIKVCRKSYSHGPWWLDSITNGLLGRLWRPSTVQLIPHRVFSNPSILKIQNLPIFCKTLTEKIKEVMIIITEATKRLVKKTK